MRVTRCALLAVVLAFQGASLAQVLYKWTDKDGRVHYGDQPPKNFSGEVTRIVPDDLPAVVSGSDGKPAANAKSEAKTEDRGIIEMAAKKRQAREQLEARLSAAREKLAAARAARDGATPQDDERQIVQQRVDQANPAPGPGSASTGGMLGMGGMMGGAQRSNCTTAQNASGTPVTTCPTPVPSDAYYDRVKKLEDAVKDAEAEVAAAETAYRRGVD